MIAHAATSIRNLTAAANALGVELPNNYGTQAEHLASIQTEQHTPPNPAKIATELAQYLGDPVAMDKARRKAATDLATAEAHAKISTALAERCAADLFGRIRRDRENVTAAFGPRLVEPLATLTADAPRLPAWFRPEQAAELAPDAFAAWDRARAAHAILVGLNGALLPLYMHNPTNILTAEAITALRYIAPPARFTDTQHAHRFARALAGTRLGGSDVGALTVQGVFAPTACAELGGAFEWATPAEVTRRIEAITKAATPPVVERERTPVSVA